MRRTPLFRFRLKYQYRIMRLPKQVKDWFLYPFVTHVDIHDRTRVEHRAVPYKLRVTAIKSLQDRLDTQSYVQLEPGTWHITTPIELRSYTHLEGLGQRSKIRSWTDVALMARNVQNAVLRHLHIDMMPPKREAV